MSATTASLLATGVNILLTRRYPVSLIHFVTTKCNARCPHCFLDFNGVKSAGDATAEQDSAFPMLLSALPSDHKKEMTLGEIDLLTRRLGPCLNNVNLTGGEPFLRRDLVEIARLYLKNAGVRTIFITTHGGFPDRIAEFVRELAAEFPNRQLIFSISVDHFQQQHDATRKVKGLFDSAVASYRMLRQHGANVLATASITISHTNYEAADALYEHLVEEHDIRSITVGAARDEGVYQLPSVSRHDVQKAFFQLHEKLDRDMKSGRLAGFGKSSLAGRMLNAKNRMVFGLLRRTMLGKQYISPCHAGAIFGIIGEQGDVYPCEILNRPLGNVRDYDYDFIRLWRDQAAAEARSWIRKSKCFCEYDCAWTFNVLANWRYQPVLLRAAMGWS